MKTITFSGASDDLIHIDGFGKKYEETYPDTANDGHVASFEIFNDTAGLKIDSLIVFVIYWGAWCFAVCNGNSDDDYKVNPDWTVTRTWGDVCPYSETLRIDVPDDAKIKRVNR